MILPNNGKVIVFDDKVEDVKDLLSALSKERIPYLYYHDELAGDLPDNPIENVRLVFLDLELVTNNPNDKNIISPIASRLKKTLSPNSLYILIYWSTKEDKYKTALEAEFENGLSDYKPLRMLTLNKAKAKEEGSEYIRQSLKEEIKQFSALNTFMLWESSVNQAAGSITNHICSIFEKKDKWNINMHGMLYRLAKAQAGNDAIKGLDKLQLLELAFDVINSSLLESVEKTFKAIGSNIELEEIKEVGSSMSEPERIKLNTKLHLMSADTSFNHFVPGNLYVQKLNGLGREIIQRNLKDDKIKELSEETTKLICLDMTPSCDYSQAKNYSRMIYGIMFDGSITRKNLITKDYRYDECPVMNFDNSSYIIFDFRCVRSFTQDEFKHKFKQQPKYRLRSNILLDIQAQLSNHINRPGIVTIN